MSDPHLARARGWIDPVLDNWCDEWAVMRRQEFCDQLAERLLAAVRTKGEAMADLCRVWTDAERCWLALDRYAADVPEVPHG